MSDALELQPPLVWMERGPWPWSHSSLRSCRTRVWMTLATKPGRLAWWVGFRTRHRALLTLLCHGRQLHWRWRLGLRAEGPSVGLSDMHQCAWEPISIAEQINSWWKTYLQMDLHIYLGPSGQVTPTDALQGNLYQIYHHRFILPGLNLVWAIDMPPSGHPCPV
jgi:hypothetical protein